MNIVRLHRFIAGLLAAVALAVGSGSARAENYSDIWWNPAAAGEGLIIIDHQTDLFVVWCTYAFGSSRWFVVPGGRLSADRRTFEGTLYQTFSRGDGDVQMERVSSIGTVRLDFGLEGAAAGSVRFTLTYVGRESSLVELRELVRQPFGTAPPAWGSDATDMWWSPKTPGWGVAAIQHGIDDIFVVLLTYDAVGNPTFFVSPMQHDRGNYFVFQYDAAAEFSADAFATAYSGTAPFNPALLSVRPAGFAAMDLHPLSAPTRMGFYTSVPPVARASLSRLPFGISK